MIQYLSPRILIFLVVSVVALPATHAQLTGGCIRAQIEAPVVMPDGAAFPAGPLRICFERRLSPISGLHHLYVDGMPVGMAVSRTSRSESLTGDRLPVVQFRQGANGRLELRAYAIPDGDAMVVFRFDAGSRRGAGSAPFDIARRHDPKWILVAATP